MPNTHTLRVIAVGFPGMRGDSAPKHAVACSCGWQSQKAWQTWMMDCPQFGDSQAKLEALTNHRRNAILRAVKGE